MSFARLLFTCMLLTAAVSPAGAANMVRDIGNIEADGGGGGGLPGRPVTPPAEEPEVTPPTTPTNPVGGVVGTVTNTVQAITGSTSETIELVAKTLRDLIDGKGGHLQVGDANVLVDVFGKCRWLDNTTDKGYFVPIATETEWDAFINNAPIGVTRAECCPATTVTMTTQDGLQTHSYNLPIGRVGATDNLGVHNLLQVFTLANGTERISESFVCENGAWTGQGPNSELTIDPEDPVVIVDPDDEEEPEVTEPVKPVTQLQSNCNRPNGGSTGGCQWGGRRNDAIAGFNWENAMYVCARGGYKYLVAASGYNGRGDCSGCTWAYWNDGTTVASNQLATLNQTPIPAATAGTWSVTSRGSQSSASGLINVWCSDSPGQRVPPHCPATQLSATVKKIGNANMSGTATINLPDGYNAKPASAGVLSETIVHPDDTRVPQEGSHDDRDSTLFYRSADRKDANLGSQDSLYTVPASVNWSDGSTSTQDVTVECRGGGDWHVYASGCKDEGWGSGIIAMLKNKSNIVCRD